MQTWTTINGVNVKTESDALLMRGLLEMLGVLPIKEAIREEFFEISLSRTAKAV